MTTDPWADLEATVKAAFGIAIGYKLAGGSAFASITAYVDDGDAIVTMDRARTVEQATTVEVLIGDLPRMPTGTDRVRLDDEPGKTFQPVNIRRNESRTHWMFELREVKGA